MNLIEPILRRARMQPQVAALIEREQMIAYGELANLVLRTANHLAKLGVTRGDQVGVCLRDDSQHVVGLLAVAYLGAMTVQIDARSRPTERSRIADAFPLRLVIVTPDTEKGVSCARVIIDDTWHSAVAAAD